MYNKNFKSWPTGDPDQTIRKRMLVYCFTVHTSGNVGFPSTGRQISRNMRKGPYVIGEQGRSRSTCTFRAGWSVSSLFLNVFYGIQLFWKRPTKAMIGLLYPQIEKGVFPSYSYKCSVKERSIILKACEKNKDPDQTAMPHSLIKVLRPCGLQSPRNL